MVIKNTLSIDRHICTQISYSIGMKTSTQHTMSWPNQSKLAVNFVINYEAGAESSPKYGDDYQETYLCDIPNACTLTAGERRTSIENHFAYGADVGIWRLHHLFDHHNIPVTVFACGRALKQNPKYCDYLRNSQHEIAGHGYRWMDYRDVAPDIEQKHIEKTLHIIQTSTGKAARGWYTGRKSNHTLQLLAKHQLTYLSDDYSSDLPHWQLIDNKPQLFIPYTLITNDCRYAMTPGFGCSHDFFLEVKYAIDQLISESRAFNLLTIALHDRLSGRPSRAHAVKQIINYLLQQPNTWITTRATIADFWRSQQPFEE